MVGTYRGLMSIGLFTLILTMGSGELHAFTGSDIVERCRNYKEGSNKNVCNLYASGMVKFATSSDKLVNPRGKLCIGSDVPLETVLATMVDWLIKNPALQQKTAYDAVYDGLAQKFRCR